MPPVVRRLSPLTPPPAAKDQLPRVAVAVAAASAATANACLTSAITKQACAVGNMDSLPRKGQDARAVSLRRTHFFHCDRPKSGLGLRLGHSRTPGFREGIAGP